MRPGREASCSEPAVDPLERLTLVVDRSFELSIAKLLEQGRESRAGLEAVADQVVAVDQRRRIDRTGWLGLQVAAAIVDFFALAERRQRIGFVQGEELFDSRSGQDSLELRLAEIAGLSQILVMGDEPGDSLAFGVGEFERKTESVGDPGADLFVVMERVAAPVEPLVAGLPSRARVRRRPG